MLQIEIKLPAVKIVLSKSDVQIFCKHVLNVFVHNKVNRLSDCGAVYAYNKLRSKVNQPKATLNLPLEYAMMLKIYCTNAVIEHDLERVVLYEIYEQLDKKMK